LGQRKFPILLFNDKLSTGQVKGRRFVCALGAPFGKQVFAILVLARRLFPETENTIITEEVKKFPDGK